MKSKKKIVIAVVVVAALIALFVGIYAATRPDTTVGAKTITVDVIHRDQSEKTFTYQTDAEYLGEVLLAEGLIEEDAENPGLYSVVDGEEAVFETDGAYWAFYVGGEYAMQGIDQTPIADGDTFALIYTIYG